MSPLPGRHASLALLRMHATGIANWVHVSLQLVSLLRSIGRLVVALLELLLVILEVLLG